MNHECLFEVRCPKPVTRLRFLAFSTERLFMSGHALHTDMRTRHNIYEPRPLYIERCRFLFQTKLAVSHLPTIAIRPRTGIRFSLSWRIRKGHHDSPSPHLPSFCQRAPFATWFSCVAVGVGFRGMPLACKLDPYACPEEFSLREGWQGASPWRGGFHGTKHERPR